MLKLNLGCGTNLLPGWDNHDQDVDLRQPLPWPDAAADYILLEHVLEHFNSAAGYSILEECWRVLKPGGVLRVCVPDVSRVAKGDADYAAFVAKQGWGSNPVKVIATCHGHEMLWTFDALAAVLGSIGFAPQRAQPRLSVHRELNNVEGHHKVVGVKFNDIETLVVEGTKPDPSQAKSPVFAERSGAPRPVPASTVTKTSLSKTAIVIASGGELFPFARDLVESIIQHRPDESVDVHVLDCGLTNEQCSELLQLGVDSIEAADVTDRARLPHLVPGHETLIWLDADTWLQDWRAIDLLSRGAADGALAIVPELHRSFSHLYQPVNDIRLSMRKSYATAFGEELARQMTWKPVLNAGVFALRTDSPLWELWARVMTDGLSRSNDPLLAQCALNVAIATSAHPVHALPQWANWPCELATPMLDGKTGLLIEPELPFEPLSIVHLGARRSTKVSLRTTDGGAIDTTLDRRAIISSLADDRG